MKLYLYDHCPFCVRSHMIFGLKGIECKVAYLPNDDEETPTRLIGKKMLPVLVTEDNQAIGESLDIVKYIDETYGPIVLTQPENPHIEAWMESSTKLIFQLAVPRWARSDFEEFREDSARNYFTAKKEAFFGDFDSLMKQSPALIDEVNQQLVKLEMLLTLPNKEQAQWSLTDIRLFPLLRSLSIVKGIHWLPKVDMWRHLIAAQSKINLHDDIAI